MNPQMPQTTAAPNPEDRVAASIPDEQARRAALYGLLAGLLRTAPTEEVLDYSRRLTGEAVGDKKELPLALSTLALAARHSDAGSLRDEYNTLFIGLGRGELVPYGSWYQTGFLMEKPLALLRADLRDLGFERDDQVREPEDHIAALCEVMSMLILDEVAIERQRQFFNSHLGNWAKDFFDDLAEAHSAVFYRSVARLGRAFMGLETRYLSLLD
jgi:TorA maturation chaperone TorD